MSMWNKRQDESAPRPVSSNTRPATPAPTPAGEIKQENTAPVSTMSFKTSESELRAGQASIGKSVKIDGHIHSKEDLYIDGDIDGTIESLENKLTIGPNGRVQASVKARELVVLGAIQGNVEATERIDIRKDARLIGDIKTARIVIEDGAYFKGSIDIVKPESRAAVVPANVSPNTVAPATPAVSQTPTARPAGISGAAAAVNAAPAETKR